MPHSSHTCVFMTRADTNWESRLPYRGEELVSAFPNGAHILSVEEDKRILLTGFVPS